MSGSLPALQAQWATYSSGMSTSQKLQALNNLQVPGTVAVDINRTDVLGILTASGALATLRVFAANPPQNSATAVIQAVNYVLAIVDYEATYMPKLQTSNPIYLASVQGMMPNLLAAGISQAVIDETSALITPKVPWWQANGFSAPVNVFDLISAGNLY